MIVGFYNKVRKFEKDEKLTSKSPTEVLKEYVTKLLAKDSEKIKSVGMTDYVKKHSLEQR